MEVDEEPKDSKDPVGAASLAHDPEIELEKTPVAEDDVSSNPDGRARSKRRGPER